jgi:hypothetical protein
VSALDPGVHADDAARHLREADEDAAAIAALRRRTREASRSWWVRFVVRRLIDDLARDEQIRRALAFDELARAVEGYRALFGVRMAQIARDDRDPALAGDLLARAVFASEARS